MTNSTQVQPTRQIFNPSLIIYVVIGYILVFTLLFVKPIFLNSAQRMQFPEYVPAENPIGIDLLQHLLFAQRLYKYHLSPYVGALDYPPLAVLVYIPLTFLDFSTAYSILTFVNVICYCVFALILATLLSKKWQISALLLFFFVTGLLSYGFQFELERGQIDVIVATLCFLSIYLFHFHRKYRYVAYVLYTLSIQLKIFPVFFFLMFIEDWKLWRKNLLRIYALGILNFGLLFILGPQIFLDFVGSMRIVASNPGVWVGNHSIKVFTTLLYGNEVDSTAKIIVLQVLLFLIFGLCLLIILRFTYRRRGFNAYLFFACTIGALIIPSISHDYNLSILIVPAALIVTALEADLETLTKSVMSVWEQVALMIGLIVFSVLYSLTLYSFTNKPEGLQNNLPILMLLLVVAVFLVYFVNAKIRPGLEINKQSYPART